MHYKITIQGNPVHKERPGFFKGHAVNMQKDVEERIKWEIKSQINDYFPIKKGIPIILRLVFYMQMSKGKEESDPHVSRPDTDNLIKMVKDCGNKVLWHDDSQICEVDAKKVYDKNPRTEITLEWK